MNTSTALEILCDYSESDLVQGKAEPVPRMNLDMSYADFFKNFLVPNKPCIIKNITRDWLLSTKWFQDDSLDLNYLRKHFGDSDVPISNCEKRIYNVQEKITMKLKTYLGYWQDLQQHSGSMDCLYLKDWHFVRDFPTENAYRVPSYFASDWLNEFYIKNSQLHDDYRFLYMGPKGSWTPFHADVFTSYSWSVNICGRKRWLILPPGEENHLKNDLGTLAYDLEDPFILSKTNGNSIEIYEVIQEKGEGIFIPSGWHHQVWNLENTLSINHNWINGCNLRFMWRALKTHLTQVKEEISDCRDMENWTGQCQLVLMASFGIDYARFYSFLVEIAASRIESLKKKIPMVVSGNWTFGKNHLLFDLKQIVGVLREFVADQDVVSLGDDIKQENLESPSSFLFLCEETLKALAALDT